MILFKTKMTGAIAGHDDKYQTGILNRQYRLVIDNGALYWSLWVEYENTGWRPVLSPGFEIGIMKPFMAPNKDEFFYDGCYLKSWAIGWFRFNIYS